MPRSLDRYFPVFIVLVLFLQFRNVGKTIDDLRRTTVRFVKTVAHGEAREFFQPRSGEQVIDKPARAAIELLRENQVTEYQASKGVENVVSYQRIIEGAWPIRVTDSAPVRLLVTSEKTPKNCKKLGEKDGMLLASCP